MKTATKIGIASLGTLALGAILYSGRCTSDDLIRYHGNDKAGNTVVSVTNSDLVRHLRFDERGQLIGQLPVFVSQGFEFGKPKLSSLVAQMSMDFPLGVEVGRILETAQDYQRTTPYEAMFKDYMRLK